LEIYGKITIVSLVKEKGSESIVGSPKQPSLNSINKIRFINYGKDKNLAYITFDVHKEVGHTRFENLKKLSALTDRSLDLYGFFYQQQDQQHQQQGLFVGFQSGVMRVNCKDNLDRTNLVQSRFAMQIANKQLEKVLPEYYSKMTPAEKSAFENELRIAWSDNGDQISIQYAGTAAMRSIRTRTGKTTVYGILYDVINSVKRYYINNFQDGANQDALDIYFMKRPLSRKYAIDWKNQPSKSNSIHATIGMVLGILVRMLQPSTFNGFTLLFCIFWMALVYLVWTILRLDPKWIVNLPVLKTNQVKVVVQEVSSPGTQNKEKEKED